MENEVVYKIEKAERKTETYDNEVKECAYLTLRKKGVESTRLVRTTKTVYKQLYETERYEENCTKKKYFIVNLGEKLSRNNKNYINFIILCKSL